MVCMRLRTLADDRFLLSELQSLVGLAAEQRPSNYTVSAICRESYGSRRLQEYLELAQMKL